MENSIEKIGKTLEEALQAAVEELGVPREKIKYDILEEKEKKGLFGLFGTKQVIVRVSVLSAEPVDVAKEFLNKIFMEMSLEVSIENFPSDEASADSITLQLRGPDLGILIGKHGQTLDALQYLSNLAANKGQEKWVRILLDVEDYRRRRSDTLNNLALRLADKAKRRNERIVLEPMNSHERKIIHMALQDDRRITTYSEGEDPCRHVVIMVKK